MTNGVLVAVVFARSALVLENETDSAGEGWIRRNVLRIRRAFTREGIDCVDTACHLVAIIKFWISALIND